MKTIRSFKCVYAIGRQAWSIVLELDEGEEKRLDMEAEKIPSFLQAFDDATEALYDEAADEVVLTFEYADLAHYEDEDDFDEDEDLDEEDEDEEDDEDEEEGDDEKSSASKKRKKTS